MTPLTTNYQTRLPKWITGWVLLFLDALIGYWAFTATALTPLRTAGYSVNQVVAIYFGIQLVWAVLYLTNNLFRGEFTASRIGEIEQIIRITFTLTVLVVFTQALGVIRTPVDATGYFQYWIIYVSGTMVNRLVVRTLQKHLLKYGIGKERTVIVGINRRGKAAGNLLNQKHQQGFALIGFVRAEDDPENGKNGEAPILGLETDLPDLITQHQITNVVLALNTPQHTRLMYIVSRINGAPVSIQIVPDLYDVISGLARTEQIAGLPLIQIRVDLDTWYLKGIKRALDLILAVPLFILSIPLWALITLAIKLDSPGPVLYKQDRVGRNGTLFTIRKFRSMVPNAEDQTGPVWADENDPRITRIGRFLRRFRLDEIPQLLNVIRGDMSLIGPRPERPYFVDKLENEFPFYHRRLRVRPGITGWAQIKHPYDRDIEDVRQKLKYDFYYIENLSFNLDLKIILSTLWVMLTGQGR